MKKRFSEEQIIGFLREAEAGLPVAALCRRHSFSEASYYLWRSKFGGINISDAKRLKALNLEGAETYAKPRIKRISRLLELVCLQVYFADFLYRAASFFVDSPPKIRR